MRGSVGCTLRLTLLCSFAALVVTRKGSLDDDEAATTAAADLGVFSDKELEDYKDLQLDGEMEDKTLRSGDRLQFRCRVKAVPNKELTFTWYHDNMVIEAGADERISIKAREWGTRLQILNIYTADSGSYRCEASDGEKSVITTAKLDVSFNLPPQGGATDIDTDIFEGKCELYQGYACAEYLKGKYIYVESFQEQKQMEQQITAALTLVGDEKRVSEKCARFARPAFCHFVFPFCEKTADDADPVAYGDDDFTYDFFGAPPAVDLAANGGTASAIRLCREDCELLQHDVCANEFTTKDPMIKQLTKTADCSRLPRTIATGAKCTRLGLGSVVDRTHVCYNDTGTKYKGVVSVAVKTGAKCKTWPAKMLMEYPELVGGHNFCRNPGNAMDRPWCYTDRERIQKEECEVPKCKSSAGGGSSDLVMILIPCVTIPLLIGCILAVMCVACRRGKGSPKDAKLVASSGKKVEMKAMVPRRTEIVELPPTLVRFSIELGEGKYGKVYKAQIVTNMIFSPSEPVAVKTVALGALPSQIADFQREMEMFSDLQHVNVACLKACVVQPTLRCMIFEYTSRMDLLEMLTLHSPHSDVDISGSASTRTSAFGLEADDFLQAAAQIAAGLEYLAARSFVHRDLAARNVLVCGGDVVKISNLGVVRDCYLSSYYRSPQRGHMLPVRWMAPESVNGNVFSEKTVVWSFGVTVWEMFAHGMQPYCGYSNHEVMDMISKGQTLACPDQCPAKVYALMRECWDEDPNRRPTCKDVCAKLSGWEVATTTRMTSQLARGIHTQLGSGAREGSQFQYAPPQNTVIDGFGQPYAAPSPLHVSPPSQPYYTSPSVSSSGMASRQSPPPSYPAYAQQPQAYGQAQMQSRMQYNRQQAAAYPYNQPGHARSNSRSTDSVSSSTRNHLHAYRPQVGGAQPPMRYQPAQAEYENSNRTPDSGIHSAQGGEDTKPVDEYRTAAVPTTPTTQNSRSRPGSGLLQDGSRQTLAIFDSAAAANVKPALAPKPPIDSPRPRANIVMGLNGQRNRNHNNHLERLNSAETTDSSASQGTKQLNGSTSGAKAMSDDSGLPNDDPEPDANQPLLVQKNDPRVDFKGRKTTLIPPGSSSSSMSGSTAVTAESRLTT